MQIWRLATERAVQLVFECSDLLNMSTHRWHTQIYFLHPGDNQLNNHRDRKKYYSYQGQNLTTLSELSRSHSWNYFLTPVEEKEQHSSGAFPFP